MREGGRGGLFSPLVTSSSMRGVCPCEGGRAGGIILTFGNEQFYEGGVSL